MKVTLSINKELCCVFTALLPEKSSTVQTVFPGITKRPRQTARQINEVNFTYSLGPQSRAVTLIAESWAAKGASRGKRWGHTYAFWLLPPAFI